MIDIEAGKRKSSEEKLKMKRPKILSTAWNLFSDYSERSTIHGVQYLGEKRRHWTERVLWLMCFAVSIACCGKLISEMHWRRIHSPVIISFAEETRKVSDIPFPTVTICVDRPTVDERILNYTEIYLSHIEYKKNLNKNKTFVPLSAEKALQLFALTVQTQICDDPFIVHKYLRPDVIDAVDRVKNFNVLAEQALLDIFDEDNSVCHIGRAGTGTVGEGVACNKLFQRTFTDGGFCYTFNYLESSKMFADGMAESFRMVEPLYSDSESPQPITYPFHLRNSAESLNLKFILTRPVSKFNDCGTINGLKVHIHSRDDLPRFRKIFFYVPINQHGHFIIRPNIVETDEGLIRNYNKNQRKCVAEHENDLIYFKRYTQSNCQVDKYLDYWLENPNISCAAAWMPHFNWTGNCIDSDISYHETYSRGNSYSKISMEKCFPACNSISYDVQLSTEKLDVFDDFREINIDITFSDEQYFTLQRSEQHSFNNFISNCGGILSLFMGVSMLSIFEIVYTWTLRAFCNLRRQNSSESNSNSPFKEKIRPRFPNSETNDFSEISDFYCERMSDMGDISNENCFHN